MLRNRIDHRVTELLFLRIPIQARCQLVRRVLHEIAEAIVLGEEIRRGSQNN